MLNFLHIEKNPSIVKKTLKLRIPYSKRLYKSLNQNSVLLSPSWSISYYFLFLVSNKIYSSEIYPLYTRSIPRIYQASGWRVQWSSISNMVEKEKQSKSSNHSYNDLKNNFRFELVLSHPSKWQLFLSCQRHHIKQCGTTSQISIFQCCPNHPCQQANNIFCTF